jgi:hypothetical protein
MDDMLIIFMTGGVEILESIVSNGINVITSMTIQEDYAKSDIEYVLNVLKNVDARYVRLARLNLLSAFYQK